MDTDDHNQAPQSQAQKNNARFRSLTSINPANYQSGIILPARGMESQRLGSDAFIEAMSLIESGLDYTQGRKKVFNCLLAGVVDKDQREKLTRHMLDHGFNPLVAMADEHGDLFQEVEPRILLEGQLAILEFEGRGLRSKQGGNLFHVLARTVPADFAFALERIRLYTNLSGREDPRVIGATEWINSRDDLGNTPLHVLWSAETLNSFYQGDNAIDPIAEKYNKRAAKATEIAHSLGADLVAKNSEGVRLWSLMRGRLAIEHRVGPVDAELVDIVEIVRSLDQELDMAAATAMAPQRNKSGLRL